MRSPQMAPVDRVSGNDPWGAPRARASRPSRSMGPPQRRIAGTVPRTRLRRFERGPAEVRTRLDRISAALFFAGMLPFSCEESILVYQRFLTPENAPIFRKDLLEGALLAEEIAIRRARSWRKRPQTRRMQDHAGRRRPLRPRKMRSSPRAGGQV